MSSSSLLFVFVVAVTVVILFPLPTLAAVSASSSSSSSSVDETTTLVTRDSTITNSTSFLSTLSLPLSPLSSLSSLSTHYDDNRHDNINSHMDDDESWDQKHNSSKHYDYDHRQLTVGDFDYFNQQFFDDNNTIIFLPDQEPVLANALTISLTNLYCTEVRIGDIQTFYTIHHWNEEATGDGTVPLVPAGYNDALHQDVTISPFSLQCYSDYTYQMGNFGLLKGSGKLRATSTDATAHLIVVLASVAGFDVVMNSIPTQIDLPMCDTSIPINDMQFEGGLDATILNLAEPLIRTMIQDQLRNVICDPIRKKGLPAMTKWFNTTKVQLESYVTMHDSLDPLYYESLIIQDNNTTNWFSFSSADSNNPSDPPSPSSSSSSSAISQLLRFGLRYLPKLLTIQPNSTNMNAKKTIMSLLQQLPWFHRTSSDDPLQFRFSFDPKNNNIDLPDNNDNTVTRRQRYLQQTIMNTTKPIPLELSIWEISIEGFDTMESSLPFQILDDSNSYYTLYNEISFTKLICHFLIQVNIKPPSIYETSMLFYNANPQDYIENMTLSFTLDHVTLNSTLLIGIDLLALDESLQLGTILNSDVMEQILSCIVRPSLSAMNITTLWMTQPVPVSQVTINGFDQTPGMARIVPIIGDAGFAMIQTTLYQALPHIFNGRMKQQFNQYLHQYFMTPSSSSSCDIMPSRTDRPYVDFRDLLLSPPSQSVAFGGSGTVPYGTILSSLYTLLQNEFFMTTSTDDNTTDSDNNSTNYDYAIELNQLLLNLITKTNKTDPNDMDNTKWYVLGEGTLFSQQKTIKFGGLQALYDIRIYDIYLNHINSINAPFEVFVPMNGTPIVVDHTIAIGTEEKPFQLGISLDLTIESGITKLHNDMDLSIGFNDLQLFLSTMLKLNETLFLAFPIRDVFTMNCWLAMMPPVSLDEYGLREKDSEISIGATDFTGTVNQFLLRMDCKNCTGKKLIEAATMLSMSEHQDAENEISTRIFNFLRSLIQDGYLQVQLDRAVNEAPKLCPHSIQYVGADNYTKPSYVPYDVTLPQTSLSFIVGLMIVCLTLVVLVVSMRIIIKIVVRRRHSEWIETLSKEQLLLLHKSQNDDKELEAHSNVTTSAMVTSRCIPLSVRLMMPIIILGNIGFFLSGHLSLGASVSILFSLGGETIRADDFFSFSMAKSTIEIWNAGGQALALMIFFASFAWPYTKQVLTLGIWLLPPRMISVKTRGNTLLWLDALAKWSIIDIFVLVVTIVCLRVSIKSPIVPYLPRGLYQIDLLVVPKWGLYANMIAQLISQVSSHCIIYYHRCIVKVAFDSYQDKKVLQRQPKPTVEKQDMSTSISSKSGSMVSFSGSLRSRPGSLRSSAGSLQFTGSVRSRSGSIRSKGNVIDENEFHDVTFHSNHSDDEEDTITETRIDDVEDKSKTIIYFHAFRRVHRGEADKIVVRRYVNPLLMFLTGSNAICFLVGCILPTFSVTIYGIVGIVVESGQAFVDATTSYSIFTVMGALFNQANVTGSIRDYIGLGTLSLLAILTVLVVPIAQSFTLLYMWLKPLSERERKQFIVIIEVLQAWQYAEVYLISVIIASWQLGPISEYMINPYCKPLKGIFAQLAFYGIIKEEDAQCMKTDIRIESFFYILFVGCLLLAIINTFVMTAVTQYLRDIDANIIHNITTQAKDSSTDDDDEESIYTRQLKEDDNIRRIKGSIMTTPVLFTDRFRWLLRREDSVVSSRTKGDIMI